ncbi:hypothetical protein WJX72_009552 [[Myrmecia] bisecta]|uniref:Uncharacterized protein n=1 Tax=[Myrmecia] bisecta TaxID=41462 RepID=A0AAW1PH20_9CHLO
MQAIQASISQVLTGVRSDMQQLDAKWSSMWQQSAGACSGLQQDLAAMRTEAEVTARHTSSEMEVLASYILPLQERLAQLELRSQGGSPASTRTIQASADRSTTLHHAPPGDQPRQDVEDDRISGVMERLSGLEGKVSAQLDQLVRLHELKVAAIKSNVRTSVSEVASQAASPPTSRLTTPYTSPAKGVAEPDGYYDTEHFYADGHHTHDDGQADTQRIEARHDRNASPIRDRLRQTNAGEHGRSPGARSAYSEAAGAGHAGSGTAGHADWMVNLGEQVGDLQARLGTAASTKSVRLVQEEIGHLRAALEARTAEAGLYRKEYDGLCRKLDKLEAAQKQAAQEARSKGCLRNHPSLTGATLYSTGPCSLPGSPQQAQRALIPHHAEQHCPGQCSPDARKSPGLGACLLSAYWQGSPVARLERLMKAELAGVTGGAANKRSVSADSRRAAALWEIPDLPFLTSSPSVCKAYGRYKRDWRP